jgi:putative glutamine amidotransferase
MTRPIVGVTGPIRGGWVAWKMTALALRRSGAIPRRIHARRNCDPAEVDGLVIGGGTDVDPFHYGESSEREDSRSGNNNLLDWLVGLVLAAFRILFASHRREYYDPERDALEQHLIQYATYNDLPVLGICRGAQLMNVALGGSLYQNIGHFYSEETGNVRSVLPRKTVAVAADSELANTLGTLRCKVNALHDQSIRELGDQLVVCAREDNGVVQAIERRGHPFFIGVQWHPEYMPQRREQLRLFRHLVRQAGKARTRAVV